MCGSEAAASSSLFGDVGVRLPKIIVVVCDRCLGILGGRFLRSASLSLFSFPQE